MKLHKIIGWSLIGSASSLFLFTLFRMSWDNPTSYLALMLFTAFLAILVIPGIIILKRSWEELSTIVSGTTCIAIFFLLISQVNFLMQSLTELNDSVGLFLLLGLPILLLPFIIPFWIHKRLKPKLRHFFERGQKAEQGA